MKPATIQTHETTTHRYNQDNLQTVTNIYVGDDKRFYKNIRTPYPNEPTTDRFAIHLSDEKGEGLVTLHDIKANEIVFVFSGKSVKSQSLFTLQKRPGEYIEDPVVMGKVLHSCEPNMTCDMTTQTFTAARDIRHGEYLTMDYESTEDELFRSFICGCGSQLCRGHIRGRLHRLPTI